MSTPNPNFALPQTQNTTYTGSWWPTIVSIFLVFLLLAVILGFGYYYSGRRKRTVAVKKT